MCMMLLPQTDEIAKNSFFPARPLNAGPRYRLFTTNPRVPSIMFRTTENQRVIFRFGWNSLTSIPSLGDYHINLDFGQFRFYQSSFIMFPPLRSRSIWVPLIFKARVHCRYAWAWVFSVEFVCTALMMCFRPQIHIRTIVNKIAVSQTQIKYL